MSWFIKKKASMQAQAINEHVEGSVIVALAGQPNVGKSTIFNMLTGLNQHVGNWPGKTVAQKIGAFDQNGRTFTLVDLPGTYSLTANSEEERIARDYILHHHPDVVVAVVDAAILERSLYLLSELLLLPAPVVLVLNMIDVAAQEGIQIEPDVLAAALNIPVVPVCATRNEGLQELITTIERLLAKEISYAPKHPTILPDHHAILIELQTLISDYVPTPYPTSWVALKMLEGDSEILTMMEEKLPANIWEEANEILYEHEDAILDIAGARYQWIGRMVRAAVIRPKVGQLGLTARLDRVLTHPFWGVIILLGVLGIVFWLTYALGTPLQEGISVLLDQFASGLRSTFSNTPHWLVHLLTDGIVEGAGMVLTFMPILIIFFTVLGLLEDSGYMARIAYLTDRFMHMMGLHGKSFIPLLLGFGCNVPSILGTRIIETKSARLLTVLLAPLVPCTARMAVVTYLAPIFFGNQAGLVTWGLITLNIGLLALSGMLLHRLILKGEQVAFIMELPLYHIPNPRTIGLYVWENVVAFLRKAGTIILGVSIIVWALAYFPTGVATESYMAQFGQWMAPLGQVMGLPWQVMTALLTSFIAKENTIATLGILYGDLESTLSEALSPASALALLVVQMLFIPCIATVATIKQESGLKWATISTLMLLVFSLGGGVLVYQVATLISGG